MTTSNADAHRDYLALVKELEVILYVAISHLTHPTPGKPAAWEHERTVMHDAVNIRRARYGLPGITIDQIKNAEQLAVGHTDYISKFALHCADLVLPAPESE